MRHGPTHWSFCGGGQSQGHGQLRYDRLDERWCTSTPGSSSRMQLRPFTQNHRTMFVLSKSISANLISHLFSQTRYCVKWRSSQGKLVLKITDNTTVSSAHLYHVSLLTYNNNLVYQVQNSFFHLSQSIRVFELVVDAKDAKPKTTRA